MEAGPGGTWDILAGRTIGKGGSGMDLLTNKAAVVTGGTRGIGFAIVRTFLENGARVALFGSRQETVEKALEKLRAAFLAADEKDRN